MVARDDASGHKLNGTYLGTTLPQGPRPLRTTGQSGLMTSPEFAFYCVGGPATYSTWYGALHPSSHEVMKTFARFGSVGGCLHSSCSMFSGHQYSNSLMWKGSRTKGENLAAALRAISTRLHARSGSGNVVAKDPRAYCLPHPITMNSSVVSQ